jgi:hypothetical protein
LFGGHVDEDVHGAVGDAGGQGHPLLLAGLLEEVPGDQRPGRQGHHEDRHYGQRQLGGESKPLHLQAS